MSATMRAAAKPLVKSAEEAARERLPKSGGLNELVASRHTRVSVLTGARTAGVRLRRGDRGASYQTNRGYISHPTFGRPDSWVSPPQQVPEAAGWWTDTMRAGSPAITPLIVAEMNRVSRIIQGGY
jgi:hypothetical protein